MACGKALVGLFILDSKTELNVLKCFICRVEL